MIFFELRFNSFLALVLSATLLVSCLDKKAEEAPLAKKEDDKVLQALQKEIAALEADKIKMQERLETSQGAIEENAIRPKMLDFFRREYFEYDKMARQIDQRIDYYKVRKALREKDVDERLKKKSLSPEQLAQEGADFEIQSQVTVQKCPWRKLPALKKNGDGKEKEKSGGHGEEKTDGHAEKKEEKPAKGGHH